MSLLCGSKISSQVNITCNAKLYLTSVGRGNFSTIAWPPIVAFRSMNVEISGHWMAIKDNKVRFEWSFFVGLRFLQKRSLQRRISDPRGSSVSASLLKNPQIASSAFTWGTVAVLPFYTLMILAPKASLTRRVMENNVPHAALGLLYAYLLCLSWTPETLSVIFATKYFLPELPGMTKMFANEMTMASAWIHLMAVDLYAARQVFFDGLKNNVETRHSVILCLLCCPIGIFTHIITKVLTKLQKDHH